MSAYVIGHITIKDAGVWEEYRSRVPATLEAWEGEVLFRGQLAEVLAGDHRHETVVALRFPSPEAAKGWYDSNAYQALIPLRKRAARVVLLRFDGEGE